MKQAGLPLQIAPIISQTLREESTSALCNWLLKLAQALTPVAYIRLWRQSLIGLGAYRSHRGYKGVAVPAADWLRSLQELRWIFSPRSESTEITLKHTVRDLLAVAKASPRLGLGTSL